MVHPIRAGSPRPKRVIYLAVKLLHHALGLGMADSSQLLFDTVLVAQRCSPKVNCTPLLEVMMLGTSNLENQQVAKEAATVAAEVSDSRNVCQSGRPSAGGG